MALRQKGSFNISIYLKTEKRFLFSYMAIDNKF